MIPNIRRHRKACGLTMTQMAELCEISIPDVSRIERGSKAPSPELLDTIARVLDVETSDLYRPLPQTAPVEALDEDVLEIATLMQALSPEERNEMRQAAISFLVQAG